MRNFDSLVTDEIAKSIRNNFTPIILLIVSWLILDATAYIIAFGKKIFFGEFKVIMYRIFYTS